MLNGEWKPASQNVQLHGNWNTCIAMNFIYSIIIYIFYHQLFLNSILCKKSAYLFSSPKLTHIYSQMQWSLNGKLKMSRKFLAGESSTIQSREYNCFQTNALWTIFLSKFFINDTVGLGPEEKPFRIIKIIYMAWWHISIVLFQLQFAK